MCGLVENYVYVQCADDNTARFTADNMKWSTERARAIALNIFMGVYQIPGALIKIAREWPYSCDYCCVQVLLFRLIARSANELRKFDVLPVHVKCIDARSEISSAAAGRCLRR